MGHEFDNIFRYVNKNHGVDFSASRSSFFEGKIKNRMAALNLGGAQQYLSFLEQQPEEVNGLIDLLTINVSRFFRNALTFESLAKNELPGIIAEKIRTTAPSIRVWSAGCAMGEEAYSIAILLNELMAKGKCEVDLTIFATDINRKILKKARAGIYHFDQIKEVKYGLLCKYFTIKEDTYTLSPAIKKKVDFSMYDIMDSRTYVPPESVFGAFDLVLCRNLLIYFNAERQDMIFDKLLRSLAPKGCLVLGKAEKLPVRFEKYFFKENNDRHIYRKRP